MWLWDVTKRFCNAIKNAIVSACSWMKRQVVSLMETDTEREAVEAVARAEAIRIAADAELTEAIASAEAAYAGAIGGIEDAISYVIDPMQDKKLSETPEEGLSEKALLELSDKFSFLVHHLTQAGDQNGSGTASQFSDIDKISYQPGDPSVAKAYQHIVNSIFEQSDWRAGVPPSYMGSLYQALAQKLTDAIHSLLEKKRKEAQPLASEEDAKQEVAAAAAPAALPEVVPPPLSAAEIKARNDKMREARIAALGSALNRQKETAAGLSSANPTPKDKPKPKPKPHK